MNEAVEGSGPKQSSLLCWQCCLPDLVLVYVMLGAKAEGEGACCIGC
jgi:hypothetical protein